METSIIYLQFISQLRKKMVLGKWAGATQNILQLYVFRPHLVHPSSQNIVCIEAILMKMPSRATPITTHKNTAYILFPIRLLLQASINIPYPIEDGLFRKRTKRAIHPGLQGVDIRESPITHRPFYYAHDPQPLCVPDSPISDRNFIGLS